MKSYSFLDNKENQIDTNLPQNETTTCSSLSVAVQSDQSSNHPNNPQTINNSLSPHQLSPSTAVRSILSNVLQQYGPSIAPPRTFRRTRTEGQYGEEITSSNRLDQLKEKAQKLNSKKRSIDSMLDASSTTTSVADVGTKTRKRPRLSKQKSEVITLSQATRAVVTLQVPSSS